MANTLGLVGSALAIVVSLLELRKLSRGVRRVRRARRSTPGGRMEYNAL